MNADVHITNETYSALHWLHVHEHSGAVSDLPDDILDAVQNAGRFGELMDMPAGHWVIVADDEVILSEFAPFRIDAS